MYISLSLSLSLSISIYLYIYIYIYVYKPSAVSTSGVQSFVPRGGAAREAPGTQPRRCLERR